MSSPDEPQSVTDPLARLEDHLTRDNVPAARRDLDEIHSAAVDAAAAEVIEIARVLGHLLEIVDCLGAEADSGSLADIVPFCREHVADVRAAMEQHENAAADVHAAVQAAHEKWGDYLELLPADSQEPVDQAHWDQAPEKSDDWSDGDENPAPDASGVDIAALLAGLPQARPAEATGTPSASAGTQQATQTSNPTSVSATLPQPPETQRPDIPDELLEAYTDDASGCLEVMEQCLLSFESDQSDVAAMERFCRELHTLKGASGSVGLAKLASYLHSLEDYIEATHKQAGTLEVERVLQCVDVVREQLAFLTGGSPLPTPAPATPPVASPARTTTASSPAPSPTRSDAGASGADGGYVRVESARLSRLLDLLAELVSLRNRRDTYVGRLREVHTGVNGCGTRMRTLAENLAGTREQGPAATATPYRARELAELSSDVAELNRSLREVFDPLGDDNQAVSRLIGEFRRELMDLQRVPVSGLFQRLHRGARDAARSEGRQIDVEFIGDDVRLERSLQERLFEPLLHVVRNAVSHGVESPDDRQAAGKTPAGRVTLLARSDTTALVFEVSDDGRGLDYERLEQKGREKGLIPVGHAVSNDRLARLILQPNFSTRTEVSEVSGRGVGMDVVATQIHRLRGRVEIDSEPGNGTRIQLRIPLRSAIEHAMVVRTGGQLFAVPMHFVHGTRTDTADLPADVPTSRLHQLLGIAPLSEETSGQRLVVGHTTANTGNRSAQANHLVVEVDELVGAEEVVVRTLPALLAGHPLYSGLTLSGRGETVLLLDVPHLIEQAAGPDEASVPVMASEDTTTAPENPTVLIVDDSLSTRRAHVRLAEQAGYSTLEATDGLHALQVLRSDRCDAVLTDLEMPRLTGFELVSEIKQRRRLGEIPVVVVTSRDDEQTHARLRKLGADAILTKPLTPAAFSEVQSVFESAKQPPTLAVPSS